MYLGHKYMLHVAQLSVVNSIIVTMGVKTFVSFGSAQMITNILPVVKCYG